MKRPDKRTPFEHVIKPQDLIAIGPIIPAAISSVNLSINPEKVEGRYLVDTGSNVTWVQKGTIKRLNSRIVNTKEVAGIGSKRANLFFAH